MKNKKNDDKISPLVTTASAAAVGGALGGPLGAIVGGVIGYYVGEEGNKVIGRDSRTGRFTTSNKGKKK